MAATVEATAAAGSAAGSAKRKVTVPSGCVSMRTFAPAAGSTAAARASLHVGRDLGHRLGGRPGAGGGGGADAQGQLLLPGLHGAIRSTNDPPVTRAQLEGRKHRGKRQARKQPDLVECCTPARAGRRGVKQAAPARISALVVLGILPALSAAAGQCPKCRRRAGPAWPPPLGSAGPG